MLNMFFSERGPEQHNTQHFHGEHALSPACFTSWRFHRAEMTGWEQREGAKKSLLNANTDWLEVKTIEGKFWS